MTRLHPTPSKAPAQVTSVAPPPAAAARSAGLLASARTALWILALLAVVAALYTARDILIPVAAAVVLSFVVAPAMRLLGRLRLPAPVSAAVVVATLLACISAAAYNLATPIGEWVVRLPEMAGPIREKLEVLRHPVAQVERASQEVERATSVSSGESTTHVVAVREPGLLQHVVGGVRGFVTKTGIALVILYFLLATGDLFKLKIVRVLPRLADKKRAVTILHEIEHQVSRFLSTVVALNLAVGVVIGLAMWAMGMPNPAVWGVMAAALNFMPVFGLIIGLSVVGAVALITFDTLWQSLSVPAVYLGLKIIEGNFVSPAVLGRSLTLNPLVIILSVMLLGWLWGPAGALLAVPILAVVKTVCDHIERLSALGELLGG